MRCQLLAPLVGGALLRCVLQQISDVEGPAVALSGVDVFGRRCAVRLCFTANLSSRGSGCCIVVSHLEGLAGGCVDGCWRLWSAVRCYVVVYSSLI